MDPNQQQLLLTGGATGDKIYAEDVFSNSRYEGNTGNSIRVYNGVNLDTTTDPPGGGMIWGKCTNKSRNWVVCDTARGINNFLSTNSTGGPTASQGFNGYYTNGFHVQNNVNTDVNETGSRYQTMTFKKQKGFFDVVKYTGNGASSRGIPHGLEAEIGFMVVKNINSGGWWCYHNTWGKNYVIELSNSSQMNSDNNWMPVAPTSTHFYVNNTGATVNVNQNTVEYIAYIWAGSQDTNTATSKSVEFDGSGDYLSIPNNAVFNDIDGVDFTMECWAKFDTHGSHDGIIHNVVNSGWTGGSWIFEPVSGNLHFYYYNASGTGNIAGGKIPKGSWQHMAITKSNRTITIYQDGKKTGQGTISGNIRTATNPLLIGGQCVGRDMDGKVSNVRITIGQVLYTDAFIPSTKPLTTTSQGAIASNVKLLCCNDSSVTGSTTTTGTITAYGNPTASTQTPFYDPNNYIFGETMNQDMVKCGEYIGDGSSDAWGGMRVHLGWEPDWLLVKDTSATGNRWRMFNSQNKWGRAPGSSGYTNILYPDRTQAEDDGTNASFPYTDGFAFTHNDSGYNGNDVRYIYIAVRRPDGLVTRSNGKSTSLPATVGTDLFQTVTGTVNSPNYKSNPIYPYFRVDFAYARVPSNSDPALIGSRKTLDDYWHTTNNNNASVAAWLMGSMNYQDGFGETYYGGNGNQAWMWTRGAGMDVVCYRGDTGMGTKYIRHSLGVPPEMIWIKRRAQSGNSGDWIVGHKDLYGGTNAWNYYLVLNKAQAEFNDQNPFANFTPTSTHFAVNTWDRVNANGTEFVAYLFASVPGFSKIGAYSGQNTDKTLDLGFTPRYFLCKGRTQPQDTWWAYFDSVRGISSGTTPRLVLNESAANVNNSFVSTTASGITLTTSYYYQNEAGYNYIYYAHA